MPERTKRLRDFAIFSGARRSIFHEHYAGTKGRRRRCSPARPTCLADAKPPQNPGTALRPVETSTSAQNCQGYRGQKYTDCLKPMPPICYHGRKIFHHFESRLLRLLITITWRLARWRYGTAGSMVSNYRRSTAIFGRRSAIRRTDHRQQFCLRAALHGLSNRRSGLSGSPVLNSFLD